MLPLETLQSEMTFNSSFKAALLLLVSFCSCSALSAENRDLDSLYNLTLAELLNIKFTTPGALTDLTREEQPA